MSAIFTLILVTSMPSVRTPLEAMNVIAGVVTVAMEGYAMVIAYNKPIVHYYGACLCF